MTRSSFLFLISLLFLNTGFSQIRVTFKVHISELPIGLGGVHVAGQFLTNQSLSIKSDWLLSAPGSQLQLLSDSTYTVSVDFPKSSAGKTLLFQFSRDSTWSNQNGDVSEGNPNECCLNTTCAMPGGNGGFDRILTIPKCGGEYKCEWNQCGSLSIFSSPFLHLSPGSQAICKGETIQLGASSDGIVSWAPNPGFSCVQCLDPFVTPLVSTTYIATSAKNNCITRDSIRIRPEVPFLQIPSDALICLGKTMPILASGNGIVEEAAHKGYNGNYVRIRHANGYHTAYSHMSRFASGMEPGVKVRQGQVIGFVGSTGLSSGPHLHFEVLVNSRFVDPMSIQVPRERKLEGKELAEFQKERARIEELMRRAPVMTANK